MVENNINKYRMYQTTHLEALDCLATTAEKLHDSETNHNLIIKNINTQAISTSYANSLFPPSALKNKTASFNSQNMPMINNSDTYSPGVIIKTTKEDMRPLNSFYMNTSYKDLLDNSYTSPSQSPPKTSVHLSGKQPPNISQMNSLSISNMLDMYHSLSSEPNRSAFDIVSPRESDSLSSPNSESSLGSGRNCLRKPVITSSTVVNMPPEQPPMLFRIDPPTSKKSSLFETLVQESHKILSTQEEEDKMKLDTSKLFEAQETLLALDKSSAQNENTSMKRNEDSKKKPHEIVLISPQKKPMKRRKVKNSINPLSDTKRAHGGPPFNPGFTPPKRNTQASALCTLYEHTLLKMATRGFWSGDRGPLQDVFRLARVENSDLQYTMNDITEHCYNVVKRKLKDAGTEQESMHKHMRSYVDEFDSYLERIYPVSSVAINIYLPTAADYAGATWHGIVPTGWSEYRRAVVIREVFEVLYNFSTKLSVIPEYNSKFFDTAVLDSTLYPISTNNNNNNNTENKKTVDNFTIAKSLPNCDSFNIKYSRVFEALWTHTAPHEPFLILNDTMQLKLREYLEQFPIESYAPPEHAIIVVDNKKYKARETLGYFRRGVQLVDYSKDLGGTVVDTVSTLINVTMTSAVRKIPPGKISKLVHPDLHLENYTNAILQIGSVVDSLSGQTALPRVKGRKRRSKFPSNEGTNKKEMKIKEEFNANIEESPSTEKLQSIASFCENLPGSISFDQSESLRMNYYNRSNNDEKKCFEQLTTDLQSCKENELKSVVNDNSCCLTKTEESINQETQTHEILRPKPEIPNIYTPDILSSMFFPPGTSGEMFSIHLMIDSYRRAAKYLLDTANHLELVARRGTKREQTDGDS